MSEQETRDEQAGATPIEPCEHMEHMVNGLSDDSIHGPAKWYTQWHVAICPKCNAALKGLREVREQVQTLRDEQPEGVVQTLTEERRAAVDSAMENPQKTGSQTSGNPL
jgi:hypothetical protein